MFSCEYCDIFKNTYLEEHPATVASALYFKFKSLNFELWSADFRTDNLKKQLPLFSNRSHLYAIYIPNYKSTLKVIKGSCERPQDELKHCFIKYISLKYFMKARKLESLGELSRICNYKYSLTEGAIERKELFQKWKDAPSKTWIL